MDAKWIGLIASLTAAGIGFTGGVVGQRYSTERAIHLERLKAVTKLRAETYSDFFSAQAKLQQARAFGFSTYGQWQSTTPDKSRANPKSFEGKIGKLLWEYELTTKEARMNLAAFGPTSVVENLSDYYLTYHRPHRKCDPDWKADAQTYVAMRSRLLEGLEDNPVAPEKLYLLMWNCRPPRRK